MRRLLLLCALAGSPLAASRAAGRETPAQIAVRSDDRMRQALQKRLGKLEAKRPRDAATVKQIAKTKEALRGIEKREAYFRAHPEAKPKISKYSQIKPKQ